jgi:hypothetical protein
MGIVGKFCDSLCETHPELARAVLSRPIGRLSEWIDWDAEGGPCGCVIGTLALAAGVAESEGERDAYVYLGKVTTLDPDRLLDVGLRINDISARLCHGTSAETFSGDHASDRRTIRLIRTRIAVALAVGAVRTGTEQPNELAGVS